jgi:TonB family protein
MVCCLPTARKIRILRCTMSEIWKNWEGQVADHKYQLLQFLGSTDHSVVFLAEFHDPEPRRAAVKFISADFPNGEQQLAAWNSAAKLTHPNLIRIYGTGRSKIEDTDLLYVAMEYAEENLAQVLPQRALMAEETRDMLDAMAGVLVFLHAKNLTHGHIKPSNVMASGDFLKLSSDTILPPGEVREMRRERSAYDAPELPDSAYTPAADIWSLGVTLVEAFTQQPAVLPYNQEADPIISPVVREPFLEIARHALRRDAKLRWSSAQIAERLNPAAVAAKAASAVAGANPSAHAVRSATVAHASPVLAAGIAAPPVSPLNLPLSKEPAVPLAKRPPVAATPLKVERPAIKPAPTAKKAGAMVLPSYVLPLFAGIFAVIAIILLPKVLRHRELTAGNASASSVTSASSGAPVDRSSSPASSVEPPAKQTMPSKRSMNEAAKPIAPEQPAATPAKSAPVTPPATAAVLHSSEAAPARAAKLSGDSSARGEVIDQVLPEPSAKAMATIQGTVRVGVRVQADAAGNVSEVTLDAPGPSKYFADQALKAARKWIFNSPESNGRSVPSEWLIEFYFKQSGVKANATQTQP